MASKRLLYSALLLATAMSSGIAEPVSSLSTLPEPVIGDQPAILSAAEARPAAASQSRLSEINHWIAESFDLPAASTLPNVAFVPAMQIASMRMRGFFSPHVTTSTAAAPGQTDTLAIYDDRTETIYLPQDWIGKSAAELSVLVHEMAHHLQKQAKLRYECPQEREHLAYRAQSRWLARSGHTLESEFEIDPFTLLVRTRCLG